jgi:hypothetical protein
MAKKVWHYVVMKSVFGDLWIGKTTLPVKNDKIFATLDEAKEKAYMLFEDRYPEFDVDLFEQGEEGNDYGQEDAYRKIYKAGDDVENEIEEIPKTLEKFI